MNQTLEMLINTYLAISGISVQSSQIEQVFGEHTIKATSLSSLPLPFLTTLAFLVKSSILVTPLYQ